MENPIIKDFMTNLSNEEGLDPETVKAVVDLYNKGKLTDKNIDVALETIRKAQPK